MIYMHVIVYFYIYPSIHPPIYLRKNSGQEVVRPEVTKPSAFRGRQLMKTFERDRELVVRVSGKTKGTGRNL